MVKTFSEGKLRIGFLLLALAVLPEVATAGEVSEECESCVESVQASLRDPKNHISCAPGAIVGGAKTVFCDSSLRVPNPFAIANAADGAIAPGCRSYLLALSNIQASQWLDEDGAKRDEKTRDEVRRGAAIIATHGDRCWLQAYGSVDALVSAAGGISATGDNGAAYCSALKPPTPPVKRAPQVTYPAFSLASDKAKAPRGSCYGDLTCEDKLLYADILKEVPPGLTAEQQTVFLLEALKAVPGNSGTRLRRAALAESFRTSAQASRGQIDRAAAVDEELKLYLQFFQQDADQYIGTLEKINQQGFLDNLSMSVLVYAGYQQPFQVAAQAYVESATRLSEYVKAKYQGDPKTRAMADEILAQIRETGAKLSQATHETGAQAVGSLNNARLAAKAALGVALTVSTAGTAGLLPFLMNGAGWAALASSGSEVARALASGEGDFWCSIADAEAKDPKSLAFAAEVAGGAAMAGVAGKVGAVAATWGRAGMATLGAVAVGGAGMMGKGAYDEVSALDAAIASEKNPETLACLQTARTQVIAGRTVDVACLLAGMANIGQAHWETAVEASAARGASKAASSEAKAGSASGERPRIEMPEPPSAAVAEGGTNRVDGITPPMGAIEHPDGIVPVDYPPKTSEKIGPPMLLEGPNGVELPGPPVRIVDAERRPLAARSTSGTPALPPSRVSSDSAPPSGLRTSSMQEVPDSAPTVTVRDSRDWRPEGPPLRTAEARAAASDSYSKAAEELLVTDRSWVSDPRRFKYNQELLIERAAAHLDASGVPYRIVSEGNHQWIEIIPEKGAGNQLSQLAVGLNRSGSTSLVYDPVYLARSGATAAYSQGSARLYMDTAAFLNLDSTGTALAHELTHFKTARSAARGVEDPFPGNFTAADGSSLASRKGEPYGDFMSSDEVSAMAHQLRRETDLEEARIVAYGGNLLSTRTADRAEDVVRYLEDPMKAAERRQIPLEFTEGPNAPRGPTAVMTVDSGKGQVFEARMPLAGGRSKAELDRQVAQEIGRDLAALELAPPGKGMSEAQEMLYESVLAEVKNGSAAIDYRMDANTGRVTAWVTPSKGGAPISVDLGGTEGAGLKRQYLALADRSRQQARIFEMNQQYIQKARKAATPEEVRAAEAARAVVNRKRPLPGDPGYDPATLAAVEREAREAYERVLATR